MLSAWFALVLLVVVAGWTGLQMRSRRTPEPALPEHPTADPVAHPWAEYEVVALLPPHTLDDGKRLLQAIGLLRSEVNSGGFNSYFYNSPGDTAPDAVRAAEAGDCPQLARLVRSAMQLFGDEYPVDIDRRQEMIDEIEENDPAAWESLDDEYLRLEEDADLDGLMRRVLLHRS